MTTKEKVIKWLLWHVDEINNNALSQKINEEDEKLNNKDLEELAECIKWVKSK